MDDNDAPYGKNRLDNGGDTNTYAPNTSGALCNVMNATILANNPNSMVNASIPTMDPKTNHK